MASRDILLLFIKFFCHKIKLFLNEPACRAFRTPKSSPGKNTIACCSLLFFVLHEKDFITRVRTSDHSLLHSFSFRCIKSWQVPFPSNLTRSYYKKYRSISHFTISREAKRLMINAINCHQLISRNFFFDYFHVFLVMR